MKLQGRKLPGHQQLAAGRGIDLWGKRFDPTGLLTNKNDE